MEFSTTGYLCTLRIIR